MKRPPPHLAAGIAERVLDSARVALWVLDTTGKTTFANPRLLSMLSDPDAAPQHVDDVPMFTLTGAPSPLAEHPFRRARDTPNPATLTTALDPRAERVARWKASALLDDAGRSRTCSSSPSTRPARPRGRRR